jgi:hypothetical protein
MIRLFERLSKSFGLGLIMYVLFKHGIHILRPPTSNNLVVGANVPHLAHGTIVVANLLHINLK